MNTKNINNNIKKYSYFYLYPIIDSLFNQSKKIIEKDIKLSNILNDNLELAYNINENKKILEMKKKEFSSVINNNYNFKNYEKIINGYNIRNDIIDNITNETYIKEIKLLIKEKILNYILNNKIKNLKNYKNKNIFYKKNNNFKNIKNFNNNNTLNNIDDISFKLNINKNILMFYNNNNINRNNNCNNKKIKRSKSNNNINLNIYNFPLNYYLLKKFKSLEFIINNSKEKKLLNYNDFILNEKNEVFIKNINNNNNYDIHLKEDSFFSFNINKNTTNENNNTNHSNVINIKKENNKILTRNIKKTKSHSYLNSNFINDVLDLNIINNLNNINKHFTKSNSINDHNNNYFIINNNLKNINNKNEINNSTANQTTNNNTITYTKTLKNNFSLGSIENNGNNITNINNNNNNNNKMISQNNINNNSITNAIITTNENLNNSNITGNNDSIYLYDKYTYEVKKQNIDKNYIENSNNKKI